MKVDYLQLIVNRSYRKEHIRFVPTPVLILGFIITLTGAIAAAGAMIALVRNAASH